MDNTYSTFAIQRMFDIKRITFHEWINRGYITPSIQAANGRGTKNLFNRLDLYRIALFRHLIETVKLPRSLAAEISKTLQTCNDKAVWHTFQTGGFKAALVIDLKGIKEQVDKLC